MKNLQSKIKPFLTTIGGFTISHPVSLRQEFTKETEALGAIISRIFLFLLPIAGMIGFISLLWTGFQILTSKGDPKSLQGAKQRLIFTIIGLIIIFLSWALLQYFRQLFGLRGSPEGYFDDL